jgi:hypothetical protein
MSGPQFFHLQSYSRKANNIGQSVEQILGEAARKPMFSDHVKGAKPYNQVYGISPDQVRAKHDEMVAACYVEATLADGRVARRGIRKDRHTLLTAVASYPLLTTQVVKGSPDREDYERWIDLNVKWLKEMFSDQLVSVIEHVDEEYAHIHAYILPLGAPSCSARHLNPAWQVKEEAEALAKENGHSGKEAVKLGNRAYRARGRELQDLYFDEVGLPAGLTRTGPKRERLSRSQWKARKEQAKKNSELLRQMSGRVEGIVDAEAQLAVDTNQRAAEVVEELAVVKVLRDEAKAAKEEADAVAKAILERAEIESQSIKQRARAELAEWARRLEGQEAKLQSDHHAFEREKREVLQDTALRTASVMARAIICVLTGDVRLSAQSQELQFSDRELAQDVERLKIAPIVLKIVGVVSEVWRRLTSLLSAADAVSEHERVSEELKPLTRPPSSGMQP